MIISDCRDNQLKKVTILDITPFKRQPHKMDKHTQTIRRLLPTNCFEYVWPFDGVRLYTPYFFFIFHFFFIFGRNFHFFHLLTIMWQFYILPIGIPSPFSSAHTALVCVLGNEVYMQQYWLLVAILTISLFWR